MESNNNTIVQKAVLVIIISSLTILGMMISPKFVHAATSVTLTVTGQRSHDWKYTFADIQDGKSDSYYLPCFVTLGMTESCVTHVHDIPNEYKDRNIEISAHEEGTISKYKKGTTDVSVRIQGYIPTCNISVVFTSKVVGVHSEVGMKVTYCGQTQEFGYGVHTWQT